MASLWPQAIAEARAIHPFERLVLDAARIAAIRHRSGEAPAHPELELRLPQHQIVDHNRAGLDD